MLCTARTDILSGVTRKTVIAIARGRGLEVKYRPLRRDPLPAVAEAFITSSSRGIVPVVQIDAVTIGEGRPGPLTLELMSAYESYVRKSAERI
jgi:branched-subunit amino acid aminotransferase/4-amino-4-deoxychorismate lyase